MEAFPRKLLSGSGKVTQVAACHQDGGRCTVPRADNCANQCSGLYLRVLHPEQTCPSWPCTPHTTLRGLVGLHGYVRAAHKVISSNACLPSTDGGTPREDDYFWPAGSSCYCLSQLKWAMVLCCQPQERVLLLRRTSSNPCCQHRGALCPVTGKDKLQQCKARPPSSREHQKP